VTLLFATVGSVRCPKKRHKLSLNYEINNEDENMKNIITTTQK